MTKIVIIDGNSLLFRAFYATYNEDKDKIMHNSNGVHTNAIFAFSNMIASIVSSLNKNDGIFVAFDKGKNTFRHKEYKEYKANRKPLDPLLKEQLPIAREFLDSINVLFYEDDEIEADDIAGIMATKASLEGYKVYIYTSDKDYLQLINDNITIQLIKKGLKDVHTMNEETFFNERGIKPYQIVDYKGLMGDPSDNLKGIPKVGDKTAKELIKKYGDLENIISSASSLTPSLAKNIEEFKDQGRFCKELAKINTHFEIPYSPTQTIYKGYDFNLLKEFANKYEFHNLINKFPKEKRIESNKDEKITYLEITSFDDIKIPDEFGFSIDSEDINYHQATLYGFSFYFNDKNYYISLENALKSQYFLSILQDENYKKYVFDYKLIKCILARYNIDLKGLKFDLLISTYLLNPSINQDINSILSYYGINIQYAFNNASLSLFNNSNPLLSSIKSYYSYILNEKIISKLLELNQYNLLVNIELPLANVLANMEIEGFPCSKKTLQEFGENYKTKINEITKLIYELVGHEFNINSTKELSQVLYDELGLKANKKRSTSIEFLKELIDYSPVVALVLEYRKYSKLLSTYVNGIIPYIDSENKIHAVFNQAVTQTGRLSSSEPNLQNISVRDDESKMLRKAFFYEDEKLNILSLDYSQIELRILASLSNCKPLIEIFNNNEDIHSATAKKVFHLNREPTSQERRKAKAVNFGIVYGISDWGLAEQLNISISEAKSIISSFYNEFPEIKDYLESIINDAIDKGYVETIFKRRRYLPELKSDNYTIREFGKRAAMNAPIQGSAADLIKIAMIKVDLGLKKEGFKAKIVSQIHDELILKVGDDEKEKVFNFVKNIMENCVKLNVPLKVEGGYAKTWFDAK